MNKLRKWGFTVAAAAGTIAPYLPIVKPVVQVVSDGLGAHRTAAQITLGALTAGLVAYQAFKADPNKQPGSAPAADSAN